SGPRAVVFSKYAAMVSQRADEAESDAKPNLLSVVRPLVRFARQLPEYVCNTQQLTPAARAVLQAIRETRQPDSLLFADLRQACGAKPFGPGGSANTEAVDAFFATLREALAELQQAYPKLQAAVEQMLLRAFSLNAPLDQARSELAHRA